MLVIKFNFKARYQVQLKARYQVQLGNACREALLRVGGIVKQSLKNTHYQVELGNEP